jgi:hypothetical protein
MRSSRRTVALLSVVVAIGGCTDATSPDHSSAIATIINREPTPEELAELPPEFAFPTEVYGYRIEGGYLNEGRTAWAHAILDYFATDAINTIEISLFNGGTAIGSPQSVTRRESETLPWRRRSVAAVTVGVPEPCGHRHDAKGSYAIYNTAVIGSLGQMFKWQEKGNGATAHFAQEPCPCDTGSGGGYGGENGEMATNIVPAEVRLECSNPPPSSTGGGSGSSGGGNWYEVTTTTCYGYLHYDSNGNHIHTTVHGCIETKSYFFAAA